MATNVKLMGNKNAAGPHKKRTIALAGVGSAIAGGTAAAAAFKFGPGGVKLAKAGVSLAKAGASSAKLSAKKGLNAMKLGASNLATKVEKARNTSTKAAIAKKNGGHALKSPLGAVQLAAHKAGRI